MLKLEMRSNVGELFMVQAESTDGPNKLTKDQPFTIVCAWCGLLMEAGRSKDVSHSICPKCQAAFLGHKGPVALADFIQGFGFPIVLVNSAVEVIEANQSALKFFGKEKRDVEGRLGGEVLECLHASETGGCGKTTHCVACAIRNSFNTTYHTGIPQIDVDSYQRIVTKEGQKTVHLKISTIKMSDTVFLKIVET